MNGAIVRIVNLVLYFFLSALAGTGLLLEFKTPLDEGDKHSCVRQAGEDWGEIHLWLGIATIILVVRNGWR
jgi:hypothetical protein